MVKKLVTYSLMGLILLNTVGFYGIFLGLQVKYAMDANDNLDKELVSMADMVTFKVPLTVPYATDQVEYDRVSGEFEHQNEVYRLYQQRLYKDTLFIVCYKDAQSKKINQALSDYVKTFADKPQSAKPLAAKEAPSLIKDYLQTGISIESEHFGWENSIRFGANVNAYDFLHFSRIKYPPKPLFHFHFS